MTSGRTSLAIRLALGALVGFGFISPTASAVLSVGGSDAASATLAGGVVGLVAFVGIVLRGGHVR